MESVDLEQLPAPAAAPSSRAQPRPAWPRRRPWRSRRAHPGHNKLDILKGLASRARCALLRSRGYVRRIQEAETVLLAAIHDRSLYERTAHVTFEVFCDEVLQINPRTARRRIRLLRALEKHSLLADALRAGVLSRSQALALVPVVTSDNVAEWIERAQGVPVLELREMVRDAMVQSGHTPEPEEPRAVISFTAPMTAGLALEHGIETARRMLGWEAPRNDCIAAILTEADSSFPQDLVAGTLEDGVSDEDFMDEPAPRWPRPKRRPETTRRRPPAFDPAEARCSDARLKALRKTIRRYERRLDHAERFADNAVDAAQDLSVDQILAAWKTLHALSAPFYVLETRLLHRLRAAMAMESLGYRNLFEFIMRDLRVSDRTAASLIRHGALFSALPRVAQAFIQGKIGRTQLTFLKGPETLLNPWWLQRAAEVTHRQFAREMRFLYRFQEIEQEEFGNEDFSLVLCAPPWKTVESILRRRLANHGVSPEALEKDFAERDLLDPPGAPADPAENPNVFNRLEILLDKLVIARSELHETDALPPVLAKTLSAGRRHRVHALVQECVLMHWHRLVARIRRLVGWLPPWAATVMLLAAATSTWEATHKDYDPTEEAILQRDGYRCRVPGCTRRRGLEVHHMIFRSHQGPDDPWNLITLCAMHHRHAVHLETLHVWGRAPHALTWEVGLRPGQRPRWIYKGDRLVARA